MPHYFLGGFFFDVIYMVAHLLWLPITNPWIFWWNHIDSQASWPNGHLSYKSTISILFTRLVVLIGMLINGLGRNPNFNEEDTTNAMWHGEVDLEAMLGWHASTYMCTLLGCFGMYPKATHVVGIPKVMMS